MDSETRIIDDVKVEINKSVSVEQYAEKKQARMSAVAIISSTNACPFRWWNNHYLCFYCDNRFVDFSELERHNRNDHVHVDETKIMKAQTVIGRYKRVKLNFRSFSCKLCGHSAVDFDALKKHLTEIHKKKIDFVNDGVFPFKIDDEGHTCVICGQSFHDYTMLNRHINNHFPNSICDQCGISFATADRLKAHTAVHLDGPFACETCGKVFAKISAKKDHVDRVHLQLKRYKCPHCSQAFADYKKRVNHMITLHGAKAPEFKCSHCPKVFKFSSRLREHERVRHLKTKKYECEICKKLCVGASSLKYHMVTHTGEKNFECQVCKKKYGRKSTLVEHMRIHNNDRRFMCQFCESAFVQKCSLKSHMKTHHNYEIKTEYTENRNN